MRITNRRRFQNFIRVVVVFGIAWLLCHVHPMTTSWVSVQSGPPDENGQWRIFEVVATPWQGICQVEWQPITDVPVYCPRWAYVRGVPDSMVDRRESMAEAIITGQAVWANSWLLLVVAWLIFLDIRGWCLDRIQDKPRPQGSSGARSSA